jgi:hypothetical protein
MASLPILSSTLIFSLLQIPSTQLAPCLALLHLLSNNIQLNSLGKPKVDFTNLSKNLSFAQPSPITAIPSSLEPNPTLSVIGKQISFAFPY